MSRPAQPLELGRAVGDERACVLRGGWVVGPDWEGRADVVVAGERIVDAAGRTPVEPGQAVDVGGLLVLPGAVDPHVHFDEPGRSDWEGWSTGSAAAAAGGVTTVVDMPIDCAPPTLEPAAVRAKVAAARASSLVDFALWGGLVPDNASPARLDRLLRSGVVGLKAFFCDSGWAEFPPVDDRALVVGLEATKRSGLVLAAHCEEGSLLAEGPATSGRRPTEAEVAAVARLGHSAQAVGARAHVVHCSSADAAEEARRWTALTVETCPHYLLLDEEEASAIGPLACCAPPVRDLANRDRLWHLLGAGGIDVLASDHSPAPPGLKAAPVPFAGIDGVQTGLSALLDAGRVEPSLIARLRAAAAGLLGLAGKGAIAPGYDADLVLVDPEATWTVTRESQRSRHRASPLTGRRLRGRVVATIRRGVVIALDGEVGDGGGRWLTPAQPGRPPARRPGAPSTGASQLGGAPSRP